MRARRHPAVLIAIPVVLVLAGCTGADLAPVPDIAASPYLCDGVPRVGVELLLGGAASPDRTGGAWGDDGVGFNCAVGHGDAVVLINDELSDSSPLGPTDEDVRTSMRASGGEPIEAGSPGSGYVWSDVSAGWVCDGRTLTVEASLVDATGRDRVADVTNLLVSMLPWTHHEPPRRVSPGPSTGRPSHDDASAIADYLPDVSVAQG